MSGYVSIELNKGNIFLVHQNQSFGSQEIEEANMYNFENYIHFIESQKKCI